MTIVYDFLATSHRLRAGPNAKTKDDRTDKLIYDIASGFEGTDDGSAVRPCQNKTLSTWINRINFKNPICLSQFELNSNVVEIKDCLNVIFSDFIKMYLKHLNVAPTFIRNNI